MEIRHVRYFVAVAETLSFTKAAVMLHLAQPSLTRQIKGLEDELGVQLVDRRKQKIRLTDEGHSFLVDSKRLLELAQEMVESVQRLKRGEVSALNVGYATISFMTCCRRRLPPSDDCSLPLRSIFSTCRTVINFARSRRARSPSASSDYTSLSKNEACNFGRLRLMKPSLLFGKTSLWRAKPS